MTMIDRHVSKVVVAVACVVASGCGKSSAPTSDVVTQNYGMVLGTVKNTVGTLLASVTVSAGGKTATTNGQGYFALSGLAATERLVVAFSKQSYVANTRIEKVRAGESVFVEATIAGEGSTTAISGADGGTATTTNGAVVTFPPAALVTAQGTPYTGTVSIAVTAFDPTTTAGLAAFPGRFEGVADGGATVPFRSFGFIDVTPRDTDGGTLQLATGKTAAIAVPIAASLVATAPATIPLWYFNASDGQWHEEGVAARDGGAYVGSVSHFTPWNCDQQMQTSTLVGRVVTCGPDGGVDGGVDAGSDAGTTAAAVTPVRGARVIVVGQTGWRAEESSTPTDGTFTLSVMASGVADLSASIGGTTSGHSTITTAGALQTLNVGDICVTTAPVRVVLTWGTNPRDLDAHLTTPGADGGRDHVYWGNKSAGGATLDTDMTGGLGPEIVTIRELRAGVYRYSVHHFSGESTISASGASVDLVVDGVGIYNFRPGHGATGVNDAWRVFDLTVTSGRVSAVTALDAYLLNAVFSSTASFSP